MSDLTFTIALERPRALRPSRAAVHGGGQATPRDQRLIDRAISVDEMFHASTWDL
ncbi:MAG TPA: hypothetical protein VND95_15830 [Stellaceae bacterium]|nr:hypothetical protein [Stellaceae bacterium]